MFRDKIKYRKLYYRNEFRTKMRKRYLERQRSKLKDGNICLEILYVLGNCKFIL